MCDNCKNCKGNVGNIALAFNDNQAPIRAVFTKYGMPNMEPTPQNAVTGTVAFGEQFAKEVALAAANGTQSSFTAEQNSNNLDLAGKIFSILGAAADTGIDIGKGVLDITSNGQKGQPVTLPNTQGQPQVVYVQQPQQAAPQKQSGFSSNQLLLLVVAGAAIVAVIFLVKGKKQGA